jgi:outer membrane protein TolC
VQRKALDAAREVMSQHALASYYRQVRLPAARQVTAAAPAQRALGLVSECETLDSARAELADRRLAVASSRVYRLAEARLRRALGGGQVDGPVPSEPIVAAAAGP